MSVLLVEDDQSLANGLLHAMQRAGLTVDHAADGEEAIARIDTRRYSVVVVDLLLPRRDGIEVIAHVRAQRERATTPVIVLTAADPAALREVDRSIVKAILFKPVDPEQVAAYVAVTRSRLPGS